MKNGKLRRVFDLELKLSLVRQIEKGELRVSEVSKIYGISSTAIYKKQNRVVVESKSLSKKNKELQARIKYLERAFGQKQMHIDYMEKFMEFSSEHLGDDIEKKFKRLP